MDIIKKDEDILDNIINMFKSQLIIPKNQKKIGFFKYLNKKIVNDD